MLTLASGSPQRKAILEQLGIEFTTAEPSAAELTEGDPRTVAMENALAKTRSVGGERVLGADTVVALGDRIFGKPGNEAEAEDFLRALSGRPHEVWTGIALLKDGNEEVVDAARTSVRFRALDDSLIAWYLATEEWRDRAGGYAIQGHGAALVESIDGDYFNVVGLPVSLLLTLAPWLLMPTA